jgi:hypothetical protein
MSGRTFRLWILLRRLRGCSLFCPPPLSCCDDRSTACSTESAILLRSRRSANFSSRRCPSLSLCFRDTLPGGGAHLASAVHVRTGCDFFGSHRVKHGFEFTNLSVDSIFLAFKAFDGGKDDIVREFWICHSFHICNTHQSDSVIVCWPNGNAQLNTLQIGRLFRGFERSVFTVIIGMVHLSAWIRWYLQVPSPEPRRRGRPSAHRG